MILNQKFYVTFKEKLEYKDTLHQINFKKMRRCGKMNQGDGLNETLREI